MEKLATEQPDIVAIFQNLPFAIIILDSDNIIRHLNPAGEHFLQKSQKIICGHDINDYIHFADSRIGLKNIDANSHMAMRNSLLSIANLKEVRVDFSLSPISQFHGWHILSIMESQNKLLWQDDSESDAGFLAQGPEILAHEIKNPLAAIKGAAQLLGRNIAHSKRALPDLICKEVDRIARLIDQMQSLMTKLGEENFITNIYEPLQQAKNILLTAGRLDNIRLSEDFDPSLPHALLNHNNIVQVVVNILDNAIDATSQVDNPHIKITTKYVSGGRFRREGGDHQFYPLPVELTISDNGNGIPADRQDDVFAPFYTTKNHGHGLGLALVRKFMQDMQGAVIYERDRQNGWSHFKLYFAIENIAHSQI